MQKNLSWFPIEIPHSQRLGPTKFQLGTPIRCPNAPKRLPASILKHLGLQKSSKMLQNSCPLVFWEILQNKKTMKCHITNHNFGKNHLTTSIPNIKSKSQINRTQNFLTVDIKYQTTISSQYVKNGCSFSQGFFKTQIAIKHMFFCHFTVLNTFCIFSFFLLQDSKTK